MTVGGAKITRTKKTGRIVKSKQVKVLYPQDNTFVGKSKRLAEYFIQRTTKNVTPMYHFEASVKNKRKYNPVRAVQTGVQARAKFEIGGAMIKQLRPPGSLSNPFPYKSKALSTVVQGTFPR